MLTRETGLGVRSSDPQGAGEEQEDRVQGPEQRRLLHIQGLPEYDSAEFGEVGSECREAGQDGDPAVLVDQCGDRWPG